MARSMRTEVIFLIGLMVGLVINSMLSGMFIRNGAEQTSLRSYKLDNAGDVFDDDDTSVAEKLSTRVRVACVVMTDAGRLNSMGRDVRATWGSRCNEVLYVSTVANETFPAIAIPEGPDRTLHALKYAHARYKDGVDWFFKVEDNTYVVVENLRYLLSQHDPGESLMLGNPWFTWRKLFGEESTNSGCLSRQALARFVDNTQDVECKDIVDCSAKAGLKTVDTKDVHGRCRFSTYLKSFRHLEEIRASVSDYAVVFHQLSRLEMYVLEYFVYRLKPVGIKGLPQSLNPDSVKYV